MCARARVYPCNKYMTPSWRTLTVVLFLASLEYRCQPREPVYDLVYLQTVTRDYATVVYETEQPTASRVDYCHYQKVADEPSLDDSERNRETAEPSEATTQYQKVVAAPQFDDGERYIGTVESPQGAALSQKVSDDSNSEDEDRYVGTVESPELTTMHKVVIPLLADNIYYSYLVMSEDMQGASGTSSDPCTQIDGTVLRPSAREPFVFSAMGDTHANGGMMQSLLPRNFQKYRFLIHTGDALNDDGDGGAWALDFFRYGRTVFGSLPVYMAVGNHDKNERQFLRYHAYPGERSYYAFSYSVARFIVINTSSDYSPDSVQYEWLRAELTSLAAMRAKWRVVVFHKPPFSEGWGNCGNFDGDHGVRDTLVPLLESSRVNLVLNGHTHGYERGTLNGVTYVTTGGGGGKTDHFCQDWPHITVSAYQHHRVDFEVSANAIMASAYGQDQRLIDSFTLSYDETVDSLHVSE
jgi:acid phosphatase type 7